MKQLTLSTGEWLLVEVPEDSLSVDWNITGKWIYLSPLSFRIELPTGEWQLIGKGDSLNEQQWGEIVERWAGTYFKDYESDPFAKTGTAYMIPSSSGMSLLKHNGMEPSQVVILKRLK